MRGLVFTGLFAGLSCLIVFFAVASDSPQTDAATDTTTTTATTTIDQGPLTGRRSDSCNSPGLDAVTHERVRRTRRAADFRPTCEQITTANNTRRVIEVIGGSEGWNFLFPWHIKELFSYQNFLTAVTLWPEFCGDNVGPYFADLTPIDACKRELATVFANFAQETGALTPDRDIPNWRQGLFFLTEDGCTNEEEACAYRACEGWQVSPCADGKAYYGRGPYQLSWNYNYAPFSKAMFGDDMVLVNDPDKLVSEGWLAFASAIWFHMTPQSPKPSGHEVVYGHFIPNAADIQAQRIPGFGVQIMLINGGLECGWAAWGENLVKARNRRLYYEAFAAHFGVDPGPNLECTGMTSFFGGSSAYGEQYWDQDGGVCGCRRVAWATRDSLFDTPDNIDTAYCRCVARFFASDICPGAANVSFETGWESVGAAAQCDLGVLLPDVPEATGTGGLPVTPPPLDPIIWSDEDDDTTPPPAPATTPPPSTPRPGRFAEVRVTLTGATHQRATTDEEKLVEALSRALTASWKPIAVADIEVVSVTEIADTGFPLAGNRRLLLVGVEVTFRIWGLDFTDEDVEQMAWRVDGQADAILEELVNQGFNTLIHIEVHCALLCTDEPDLVFECDDGSTVGRDVCNDCKFFECPLSGASLSSTPTAASVLLVLMALAYAGVWQR